MRRVRNVLILAYTLLVVQPVHPGAAQPFSFRFVQHELTDLNYATLSFADVDRNGSLDLVATGNAAVQPPFRPAAHLVLNGAEERPLVDGLWHSALAWADFDRDGAPDFVLTGTSLPEPPFDAVSRLYRNTGDGSFEALTAPLPGLFGGHASWGDFDRDGDEDLLLMGVDTTGAHVTALYRNDGGDAFREVPVNLPGLAFGSSAWADFDRDGHPDLLLTGARQTGAFRTIILRNNGTGTFSDTDAGLAGVAFGTAAWGDYDNDGDPDILLSGGRLGPNLLEGVTVVYRNDGGRFARLDVDLPGVAYGTAAWGDYDNDGDLDVLVVGEREIGRARLNRVYQNQGEGRFVHVLNLIGVSVATAAWADRDGDNDLDLVIAGTSVDGRPLTNVYRNEQTRVNAAPSAPTGLRAGVNGTTATLSWEAASDPETPAPGLSYNLRVGTEAGGVDVVAPLADPRSGTRYIAAYGNAGSVLRRVVEGLPGGTYYWSVQSIDHSFTTSEFAQEGTFEIASDGKTGTDVAHGPGLPKEAGLLPNYPEPFARSTTLVYELPVAAHVELQVFDILGRAICVIARREQAPGRHEAVWNGLDAAGRRAGAGVYFARLRTLGGTWTRKLLLLD